MIIKGNNIKYSILKEMKEMNKVVKIKIVKA